MASYQDIETRLAVVEDKVNFVLSIIQVTKRYASALVPGQFVEEVKNGLDLYREVKTAGASVIALTDPDPEKEKENDGTV